MSEEALGCSIPHLTLGEGSAWSLQRLIHPAPNSLVDWLCLTILDNLGLDSRRPPTDTSAPNFDIR
ncbi:protein of unknown function [Methylotuvimicrobium alcaliphilum 20Z]|uniref:Uncharacterized protein n=1 Tax=Methylotuvimicrobium alcaliphilum (strain DSM 19304 / NCIMB 14124 / VKM B-2133 / 20Z) TaxID=1091494 RepID=G4SWS0_META2|nr:protein of unknown function [Methylotuvimicrobium alcaliphilum 20Z]